MAAIPDRTLLLVSTAYFIPEGWGVRVHPPVAWGGREGGEGRITICVVVSVTHCYLRTSKLEESYDQYGHSVLGHKSAH